jgi:hypothetical protein
MNRGCELVLGINNKEKYNVCLRDINLIYILHVCLLLFDYIGLCLFVEHK